MKNKKQKLIVILGPTASGKSELAIKLAKKFKGEIVSADSRQIYKEMEIGTAKPKSTKGIDHYLIDTIRPNKEYNAALFKKAAVKAIENIQRRKKNPFLVGGTGLYIRAVVDNIQFPKVPANNKLRKELEKKNIKDLFRIYKKLDPQGSKLIDRENKRRLVRAIEVCKITGQSFWQQRQKEKPLFEILQIGLKPSKALLRSNIKKRIENMFRQGLEKEARFLSKKYGSIPPLNTIGYQEWKEFFEGKIDKDKVKELIISHTNKFARRQMTWFKKDKTIHWAKDQKTAERLIRKFLKQNTPR